MAEPGARRADWLSIHEALERVLGAVRPLGAERVSLSEVLGRTIAETVHSPIDQPPWDNSAMDGFAVRAEDIRGADRDSPVMLELLEEVAAGDFPSRPVGPGEATKIMTGAPVPDGADSVVRVEHTDAWKGDDRPADDGGTEPAGTADDATGPDGTGRVTIYEDGDAGRNIRRRGEDLATGAVVLEDGAVLRAAEVGILATVGRSHIAVHRRPRVAILSNGDELAEIDAFHEVRAGRRIVDSNAYALAAAIRAAGAVPVPLGIARDDETSLRTHLQAALDADVLVTTAGASVGEHDLIKDVLDALGFELDFWRVSIRPGSPFSFGHLPRWREQADVGGTDVDSRRATSSAGHSGGPADEGGFVGNPSSGSTSAGRAAHAEAVPSARLPVFGLAGNPVSALVTFEVLVRPALRRMQGRKRVHPATIRVVAADRMPSKPGLTHFLRVRLERDDSGPPRARLTGPQGSGILTSMREADALLVVPEAADGIEPDAPAVAIPLPAPDAAQGRTGYGSTTD